MRTSSDLRRAADMLKSGGYTCVLVCGDSIVTSHERGVKPLLGFLDSGSDYSDHCAADKVIGKGAAVVYVALKIREIYAPVVSRPALEFLKANGVSVVCDEIPDGILNRMKTGSCPMEAAVLDIDDQEQALTAVKETAARLAAAAKAGSR